MLSETYGGRANSKRNAITSASQTPHVIVASLVPVYPARRRSLNEGLSITDPPSRVVDDPSILVLCSLVKVK